jgi:hypothetical protein
VADGVVVVVGAAVVVVGAAVVVVGAAVVVVGAAVVVVGPAVVVVELVEDVGVPSPTVVDAKGGTGEVGVTTNVTGSTVPGEHVNVMLKPRLATATTETSLNTTSPAPLGVHDASSRVAVTDASLNNPAVAVSGPADPEPVKTCVPSSVFEPLMVTVKLVGIESPGATSPRPSGPPASSTLPGSEIVTVCPVTSTGAPKLTVAGAVPVTVMGSSNGFGDNAAGSEQELVLS